MIKNFLVLISIIFLPAFSFAAEVSKLFSQGSYDTAFRVGYADALGGDPESSYIIGRILVEGKGSGKENISKGIDFLKSSANSNYLKAVEFLAINYDEGQFTSENSSLALKYYEQAGKLGLKKARKRIKELRIALFGKISKKSCETYNKKDKKNYFNIAQCIARNFLDGNASSYYLMAFDNGNSGAYLLAAQRMLKAQNIDLMPLAKRIPDFRSKANKSQKEKFIKLINNYGYDESFCGKVVKKNRFSKETQSNGNNAGCALAAEAGDQVASTKVYEWWKNGTNGFPKKIKYAESLLNKLEVNDDVDIAELLKKYEDDPRLHFQKAMEFINTNKFNKKIVSKELKLELRLIAENKIDEFAKEYRDIADVIEYVDWEFVDSDVLAKFYLFYMKELKEEDDLLTTPRVKKNIRKIPYKKSFISSLSSLKGGGLLANEFLNTAIFNDCDALNYALKNRDSLDLSFEIIQDARDQSLNKCDFAIAKKSMKELLEIAKRDIDAARPFVEKRLNHRLPCKDFSDFLTYNMNPYDDFDVNYERLTDQCADFPIISYQLAEKAYNNKDYDLAYDYALQGCENTDHKSKGCDLLALIIIKGETINVSNQTYDERMQNAISYLTVGHESKDIDSTAFLHDISNKPILFSRFSDNELAKELIIDLEKSKDMSAKIQVKKNCFSADPLKSLFKNCKPVCAWAKRNKNNDQMGIVDKYLLNSIFKKPACNPQTN